MNGGSPTYLGVPVPFDINTLLAIEFVAIAGAEALRNGEADREKRKYPGGAFDPLGFSKDAKAFETNKLKVRSPPGPRPLARLAVPGTAS